MELEQLRYRSKADATLGLLFEIEDTRELLCFVLEDEARDVKVAGETRIPAGRYKIELRTEGGMNERYSRRFPSLHKGMLWLRNVPGFEWIYLHIGNDEDDTDGCPLLGEDRNEATMRVVGSTNAYLHVYSRIVQAIVDRNEPVWLTVIDYDKPRWANPGG